MSANTKQNAKGFTIIEVMIVLAIAGLIMLILFLAVPALQRNSRNSARRSDIGRFGAAVNEHVSNNNGTFPTEAQMAAIMTSMGNMGNYATADRMANAAGAQGVLTSTANTPHFRLVTGARCSTSTTGATDAASTRQAAIQYQLETSNGSAHTNVCQEV